MAALPYMQLYVADYLADTMHLSTEEHGAYMLLIFNYWQTGKPLPYNKERLAIIARMSNERWTDVENTLKEFFVEKDGFLYHPRIEADLKHVESVQEKAVLAGKASAKARKAKKQQKDSVRGNGRSTDAEQPYQHEGNHTDPDPDPNKKENTPLAMLVSFGVEKQIATDWLKVRKLKKLASTETAFNKIKSVAEKNGMTMNEAVTIAVENSWGGFNPKWLKNNEQQQKYNYEEL